MSPQSHARDPCWLDYSMIFMEHASDKFDRRTWKQLTTWAPFASEGCHHILLALLLVDKSCNFACDLQGLICGLAGVTRPETFSFTRSTTWAALATRTPVACGVPDESDIVELLSETSMQDMRKHIANEFHFVGLNRHGY